jgi:parallel beta-helix repeat protein
MNNMKKGTLSILVCMLMMLTAIAPISATALPEKTTHPLVKGNTLYVGGSGPNNYTKIQDAIDNASNGDTVFVFDDSSPYYESVHIGKSITLQGENKYSTVIDNSHTVSNGVGISTDNVTVTGFTIQNGGTGVNIGGPESTASHNIVTDNIFLNRSAGVDIFYGSPTNTEFTNYGYNIIVNNVISYTKFYGIRIVFGRNNLVARNTISPAGNYNNSYGYGFGIDVSGVYNNISYNNVSNNYQFGIAIGESYKNEIFRNNIEKNRLYGLVIEAGSADRIIQNNFIGNRRSAVFNQQIKFYPKKQILLYPFLPCLWRENYWNKPRTLPYIVRGTIGYMGLFYILFWAKYNILPTNFVRLDVSPAQAPYTIP